MALPPPFSEAEGGKSLNSRCTIENQTKLSWERGEPAFEQWCVGGKRKQPHTMDPRSCAI